MPDPRTAEERLRAALEVISTGSHPDGHRGAVLVARAALAVEPVPVPLAHDDVPYPKQCQTCVDAHYAALATPPEPEP